MNRRKWNLTMVTLLIVAISATMLLVPCAMAGNGGDTVRVNINTADTGKLATLPGIGNAKATAIVQYRSKHGPFTTIDDLVKVQGIGINLLEKIRDLVQTK